MAFMLYDLGRLCLMHISVTRKAQGHFAVFLTDQPVFSLLLFVIDGIRISVIEKSVDLIYF